MTDEEHLERLSTLVALQIRAEELVRDLAKAVDEAGRDAPYGRNLAVARTHTEDGLLRLELAVQQAHPRHL